MSTSKSILLLSVISFLSAISVRPLLASCGTLSCPLASPVVAGNGSEPGLLQLDYSHQYIDQSEARIGTGKAAVGAIRAHHDEISTVSKIHTLRATVLAHERLAVQMELPFIEREHRHIHNHRGTPLLDSWSFSGIGDAALLLRCKVWRGGDPIGAGLSVIAGGKFPTGKTNALGAAQRTDRSLAPAEGETGIQPGSGAYDFLTGISGERSFGALSLGGGTGIATVFAEVLGRFTGKGKEDYRLGNSLTAAAGLRYPTALKLAATAQMNLRYSRKDERGATHEEIDKTGGVWLYATPGLELLPSRDLSLYAHVQVPVYQNVNSIQLVSAYNLILGVGYKFNLLR